MGVPTVRTHHVHLTRDTFVPVVPEDRYAADAHRHGPGGAHQQPRDQLGHVATVVQRVHYRYVPGTRQPCRSIIKFD